MGHWSVGEAMVAQAGEARLALIGCSSATGKLLLREAERLRDLVELDRLAGALAGSFHLVASLGGRVRVQGSASGLRLVFHACLDGVTVATDRADLLAEVCGAGLDEQQVAVRLLGPFPPHPLSLTSLWRSIHTVAPGSYLALEPDGRAHESNWWTPPQPERPLAAGAEPLRDALDAAVQARTRAGGTISCDLSGGMDSTSISFLAARGPAKLIVSTALSRDPADDDAYWADLAAARMPAVEHAVWPAEQTPLAYENMSEFDDLGYRPDCCKNML
jgi:asparagine synthase (glutamine-hydrolysing)